jgi:hypothetical protein
VRPVLDAKLARLREADDSHATKLAELSQLEALRARAELELRLLEEEARRFAGEVSSSLQSLPKARAYLAHLETSTASLERTTQVTLTAITAEKVKPQPPPRQTQPRASGFFGMQQPFQPPPPQQQPWRAGPAGHGAAGAQQFQPPPQQQPWRAGPAGQGAGAQQFLLSGWLPRDSLRTALAGTQGAQAHSVKRPLHRVEVREHEVPEIRLNNSY